MTIKITVVSTIGPLRGLIYRQDRTTDARRVAEELRREASLPGKGAISILDTAVPATVAYREAATNKIPVHRHESSRSGPTPSACETMLALTGELFPHLPIELRDAADGGES